MAIDTKDERMAVMGASLPGGAITLPPPDGSLDVNDRRHMLGVMPFPDVPPSSAFTGFGYGVGRGILSQGRRR